MTALLGKNFCDAEAHSGYSGISNSRFQVCACACMGHGGANGRALVMTSGILYSVTRVEGSILVKATLSQFS